MYRKSLGYTGEDLAVNYLLEKSFTIINRNYHTRMGEIDIIAKKTDKLHFIEVKTRSNLNKGKPYEAVNQHKIHHLLKAAQFYLLKNKIKGCKLSLDVISIWLNSDNTIKEILYFENITM
ncbi:MAG: YraN family protein [Candidatus Roizmanbacteria bacterium]|nr:MAG: YraN family protein [Candidatus Roizmanbacteria bacterium]